MHGMVIAIIKFAGSTERDQAKRVGLRRFKVLDWGLSVI